ncbi:hypothetical protein LMH87_000478 [Akanthomyces muscarius]|uniref:Uncharacterized protein n=1 Tax=Akanthomyces muscarius TaxID=2231603 RepID=A0A9W8QGW4_AKAMU|nr:hypothetical protein LMH87_000478 [Akanthomyces muscarius]KAJ4155222.1 hypothetical protein LMH87_000478 [Akanthomyces muscarius]
MWPQLTQRNLGVGTIDLLQKYLQGIPHRVIFAVFIAISYSLRHIGGVPRVPGLPPLQPLSPGEPLKFQKDKRSVLFRGESRPKRLSGYCFFFPWP